MPTCSPGKAVLTRREVGCGAKAGHTHFIPGPPGAQPPSPLCWGDGARLLIGPETVLPSEQRSPGTRVRLVMEPVGLGVEPVGLGDGASGSGGWSQWVWGLPCRNAQDPSAHVGATRT